MTTGTASRSSHSLPQSGSEVEQGNGFSEVNPCRVYNPFDILRVEGFVNDPTCSNSKNEANISRLGREKGEGFSPAYMVQAESGRLVYGKSRDVTAYRSTQTGAGRQAGLAHDDAEKVKSNRYLCHSELKRNVGEVNEALGDISIKQFFFQKAVITKKLTQRRGSMILYSFLPRLRV